MMHSTYTMPVRLLLFMHCKAVTEQTVKYAWLYHIMHHGPLFYCPHNDHATVALEMMAVTGPLEVMNGTPL